MAAAEKAEVEIPHLCQLPCPGSINVQGYIGLIAQRQFGAALQLIRRKQEGPEALADAGPCHFILQRRFVRKSGQWLDEQAGKRHIEKTVQSADKAAPWTFVNPSLLNHKG